MSYLFTTNLGLVAVREEVPSAQDWAATYWNWINIDKLVYSMVQHHHTGDAALANPDAVPTLTTSETGGTLPGGKTYFGVVSYYDVFGRETGKSAAGTITTAAAIGAPATPTHNLQATPTDLISTVDGLVGGDYWYKLTYVKGGGETTGSDPVYVLVPTDDTYAATLHFDSLDTAANGADKIFIYRKSGNTGNYVKMVEISATDADYYTDDNTAVVSCDKQPPVINTTNSFNTVTFDWSGLSYGDAAYINLYVTTTGTVGTPTFLTNHRITSVATGGAGTYEWTGTALTTGKPLVTSQSIASPAKVILDSEVTGNLLLANMPPDFIGGLEVVDIHEYFDIQHAFDTSILPYLPDNPSNGQIVVVRNSETTPWPIFPNIVYLYMWRDDFDTPSWQLINSVLPFAPDGVDYTNYSVPVGAMWVDDDGSRCQLKIMQESGSPTTVPSGYVDICEQVMFWGEFDTVGDLDWIINTAYPDLWYGHTAFVWEDKSFYYYNDELATPTWVIGPGVVKTGETVADVSESATPTDVELKLNELLAVLRDSGIINT